MAPASIEEKARLLARRIKSLWHMAEAGAGARIREEGLWSTRALLERAGVPAEDREAIEAARRETSVALPDGAVIRDNGVLSEAKLAPLLPEGMAPRDWYLLLNVHVFFWPSLARCRNLLGARAYRGRAHDVLEFDTASLLAAHAERVRVTPMNTGATIHQAPPRGPEAFLPLDRWPPAPGTPYWFTPKGPRAVKEVAVLRGLSDAGRHLVGVRRCRAGPDGEAICEPIWP